MNINTDSFGVWVLDPPDEDETDTLAAVLNEHLAVLATSPGMVATAFTGRQALTPETDLPDAYRVWNETVLGTWMWIDTEGIARETADPIRFVIPDPSSGVIV